MEIGKGKSKDALTKGMRMVAEGVHTTLGVMKLADTLAIEMPIVQKVYEILYEGKDPAVAVTELMSRALKSEMHE